MASKKVNPIPKGYRTMTTSIIVKNALDAIEFYKKAFGAKKRHVSLMPDGKTVVHAEIAIGDTLLMLSDEMPQMQCFSPPTIGGTSSAIYMYVKNVDSVFNKAVAAGAKLEMPVMDAFWGDRMGALVDPFGHRWSIATRKKNMTPAQMKKAGEEFYKQMGQEQQ